MRPLRSAKALALAASALMALVLLLAPHAAPAAHASVSGQAQSATQIATRNTTQIASAVAASAIPELVPGALRQLFAAVEQQLVEGTRLVAPPLADRLELMLQPADAAPDAPASAAARTGGAMVRVGGTAVIGIVLALIVLVTALGPLEGVIKTVEADVSGAFWRGVIAQAIALPVLGTVLLLLAITVIGLLAVPIALFVSTLLVAGVSTLGVLAVAAVVGRARAKDDKARSRAGLLRALLLGYALLWIPWVIAALLVAVPVVGLGARVIALASLWVAATVGIGAVVRSRGGMRIPDAVGPVRAAIGGAAAAPDWSTPTPIGGVAAARLPTNNSSTE